MEQPAKVKKELKHQLANQAAQDRENYEERVPGQLEVVKRDIEELKENEESDFKSIHASSGRGHHHNGIHCGSRIASESQTSGRRTSRA